MIIQFRHSVAFFLLFFVTAIWAEVPVPTLSHRVTDLTATLSAEQSMALENKLAAFEAKKGSQIAVLILPTTQPETIEAFSIRVADAWKIGRKNIDDGVILIVAKDDHKLRIEVGRGLEGAIPDAIAKRVIAEIITPKFKSNNFYDGIDSGISQLIKLIDGEPLPAPKAKILQNPRILTGIMIMLSPVLLIMLLFLDCFLSKKFGELIGVLLMGCISSVITSLIFFFATSDILTTLFIVGPSAFFAGFFISFLIKAVSSSDGSGGWSWSGGTKSYSSSDSSFRGGSFTGGGFSGGGFSGGGGGFSGGGASGSW